MNDSVIEAVPWSGRRWFLTILLLFTVHLCLVLALSSFPIPRPSQPYTATRIRMVSSPAHEGLPEIMESRDPTLFALIHPKGFSGAAWLKTPEFPYRMTNPLSAPRWLSADAATLANDFLRFVQTNATPSSLMTNKPAPRVTQMAVRDRSMVLRASLRRGGELANRRLVTALALPLPDPDKILTNCVVQVIVAASGDTLSCALLTSSGSSTKDQEALNFAKSARFAPLAAERSPSGAGPTGSVFGDLVFQWLPVEMEDVGASRSP